MRTARAYELIGHEGQFRLPGGRVIYTDVMYNEATARSDRVRLARIAVKDGGLHQVNRWVNWDQEIEVLTDLPDR